MATRTCRDALESIIERRNPDSDYHRQCMAILDNTLPKELLAELSQSAGLSLRRRQKHEKQRLNTGTGRLFIAQCAYPPCNVACDPKWNADKNGGKPFSAPEIMSCHGQELPSNRIADSKQIRLIKHRAVCELSLAEYLP